MGHPRTRAERRAQRDRVVANRMRTVYDREDPRQWTEWQNKWNYGRWYRYPGRFHKKKPYDCGNPRCYCCHWDKLFDRKRYRLRAEALLRKYLDELREIDEL